MLLCYVKGGEESRRVDSRVKSTCSCKGPHIGSYMMAHKTSVIPAAEDPILCPNLQEHHTWVYDAHTHMYV